MLIEDLILLITRIQNGKYEEQTVEVKEGSKGCPKLYDTLSSFSNQSSGGTIVFGIKESQNFDLVGVYDVQDLQKKATEQCKQMEPEVRAVFTVCQIDDKNFVSMEIPAKEVALRPVYYKGAGRLKGSYVRVGEADEPMTDYEIYSYEAYRKQTKDDIRPTDADLSSIDKNLLDNYILKLQSNLPNATNLGSEELLNLMGLIKNGKPTLATVLCFSKYPQAIFPQLCITAVLIPGTKMGDQSVDGQRFLANRKIQGTIPQMADAAVNFVAMNMRVGVQIINGKRTDIPEYPLTAVREAILNALVHRDYSPYTEGIPVRIEMYTDRLEITSAGGIYGAVDIDDLGRVRADTRNKTLISILETNQVIENRYSGIPTIKRLLKEANMPEPLFIERKGFFTVVFYSNKFNQDKNLNDLEQDLIDFCKTARSRSEIAEFLGKTQYYVIKNYVEPLISKGVLAYTCPQKPKSKVNKIIAKV